MENSMGIPEKIKNTKIIQFSYPISGCLSKDYKNTNLKRYFQNPYFHHSDMYSSKDLGTT